MIEWVKESMIKKINNPPCWRQLFNNTKCRFEENMWTDWIKNKIEFITPYVKKKYRFMPVIAFLHSYFTPFPKKLVEYFFLSYWNGNRHDAKKCIPYSFFCISKVNTTQDIWSDDGIKQESCILLSILNKHDGRFPWCDTPEKQI